MTLEQIEKFLQRYQQQDLYSQIASLPLSKQKQIASELADIAKNIGEENFFSRQDACSSHEKLNPFQEPRQQNQEDKALGEQAIREGKVIALLLAGGDGSRLKSSRPKGCFEISLIKNKSLFQLHAEKIAALQTQLGCALPLIILTSPHNETETKSYFEKHQFFHLDPKLVFFITQPLWPLYTLEKKWFFKSLGELATGPNGNGGLFQALFPLLETLSHYEYLMISNLDNPLATLYDAALIGAHERTEAEVSLRCCEKKYSKEKVGVFAYRGNRLHIIDYTSLPENATFPYANINILCFSLSFVRRLSSQSSLPIHWIEKKGVFYDFKEDISKEITFLKGEKFLSDTIAFADKVTLLASLSEEHFAPLKGMEDVPVVKEALLRKDKKIFHRKMPLPTVYTSRTLYYFRKSLESFSDSLAVFPRIRPLLMS
jgi:UDP-N-acetylglucosamine/UDP-N-acetylgalactosamine diphosphorylase